MKVIKKVYGPYYRKDGRQHVIIHYQDGSKRTVSYPKWLVEQAINRELDPETETIDHIDDNKENNDFSNLRILPRQNHAKEDVYKYNKTHEKMKCVYCKKEFFGKIINRLDSKNRFGKSGPFCSKQCSGKYGSELKYNRISKIENKLEDTRILLKKKKVKETVKQILEKK